MLQIERVEFTQHPCMVHEQLLAAQLLKAFAAYKYRQGLNLVTFFSDRLMGLEDALLSAQHAMLDSAVRFRPLTTRA